jgi:hypothetical protein
MNCFRDFLIKILLFFTMIFNVLYGQCTDETDAEIAKYLKLLQTSNAQSCSQCAVLAAYFCTAKYTSDPQVKQVKINC